MAIIKKRDNINKISSNWMKNKLFSYFRFKRQFIFCCTEGINYADFLALNQDYLIEVEVKINKSDLINEFNPELMKENKNHNKIRKHYEEYSNPRPYLERRQLAGGDSSCMDIPNFYYLAVTEELLKTAEEQIAKVNNKYGIILISSVNGDVTIAKAAKKLHEYKPTFKTFYYIGKRTTSELATLREKYLE